MLINTAQLALMKHAKLSCDKVLALFSRAIS